MDPMFDPDKLDVRNKTPVNGVFHKWKETL